MKRIISTYSKKTALWFTQQIEGCAYKAWGNSSMITYEILVPMCTSDAVINATIQRAYIECK